MSDSLRGMPLLSGPLPANDATRRSEMSCRKCNKEFNIIFHRPKVCNHCGYSYCSSCADYQALMPRSGTETGYDPMPVCAFCVENLTFTAGGKGFLRTQPLARLKQYIQAYNISLGADILEKDDVVDAIIAARESNGCLPADNEEYYRKNSVPNGQNGRPRGLFSRRSAPRPAAAQPITRAQSQAFARPDLEPQPPAAPPGPTLRPQRAPQPRPGSQTHQAPPRPNTTYSPRSQHQPASSPPPRHQPANPVPPQGQRVPSSNSSPYQRTDGARSSHNLHVPPSNAPRPETNNATRPRATSAAATARQAPPVPLPTLDELLNMSEENVAKLSVGMLKTILFQNHVNARLVLEKSDLVTRVMGLLADERRERERDAAIREQEEKEVIERQHRMMAEQRARDEQRRSESEGQQVGSDDQGAMDDQGNADSSPPLSTKPPPLAPEAQAKAAALERNGLCVVCQDEDANIAIVDCGHLALCRSCSDLIMAGSRECPLCRTRIVTEARLLRIFKT